MAILWDKTKIGIGKIPKNVLPKVGIKFRKTLSEPRKSESKNPKIGI